MAYHFSEWCAFFFDMQNLQLKYEFLKRELSLTDADIARMFGYKNSASFYYSSRKLKTIQGIISIIELINPDFFAGLDSGDGD